MIWFLWIISTALRKKVLEYLILKANDMRQEMMSTQAHRRKRPVGKNTTLFSHTYKYVSTLETRQALGTFVWRSYIAKRVGYALLTSSLRISCLVSCLLHVYHVYFMFPQLWNARFNIFIPVFLETLYFFMFRTVSDLFTSTARMTTSAGVTTNRPTYIGINKNYLRKIAEL